MVHYRALNKRGLERLANGGPTGIAYGSDPRRFAKRLKTKGSKSRKQNRGSKKKETRYGGEEAVSGQAFITIQGNQGDGSPPRPRVTNNLLENRAKSGPTWYRCALKPRG